MTKNKDKMDLRDKHQAAMAKLNHMDKLKSALRIRDDLEEGACFDMELQERKREERLAEKDKKRKEQKRARKEAKREKQREELQRQLLMVQQTVELEEKQKKAIATEIEAQKVVDEV